MTGSSDWMAAREPRAPGELAEACASVDLTGGAESRAMALRDAAAHRLACSLARPGRVRESAFDLLVADALVTYACESALEAGDVEAALEDIVGVGRGPTGSDGPGGDG